MIAACALRDAAADAYLLAREDPTRAWLANVHDSQSELSAAAHSRTDRSSPPRLSN
jgi:hypothetical protein